MMRTLNDLSYEELESYRSICKAEAALIDVKHYVEKKLNSYNTMKRNLLNQIVQEERFESPDNFERFRNTDES